MSDTRVSRQIELEDVDKAVRRCDVQDRLAEHVLSAQVQFRGPACSLDGGTHPRDLVIVDSLIQKPLAEVRAPLDRREMQARLPRLRIRVPVVSLARVVRRQAVCEAREERECRAGGRCGEGGAETGAGIPPVDEGH